MIGYTLYSAGDEWEFMRDKERVKARVTPRFRTNNGDTCVAVAISGAGIVLQPTFLVGDHLASGTLVELLPTYRSLELGVFAVYPTRKFVLPKVRVFIEYLSASFSGVTWAAAD